MSGNVPNTPPPITTGEIWTADQWSNAWQQKADLSNLGSYFGYGLPVTFSNSSTGGVPPGSGSMTLWPNTDPYQSPTSWAEYGSLTIRGNPYGFYDTGTLLSMVATTLPLSSSRAGVNGGFEAGVSAIAGYGSFDSVNLYSGVTSQEPPLILHNVTYDATHVYPSVALTTSQMQLLRLNMWVLTNSVDSTVNPNPPVANGTPPLTVYGSFVTGWAVDGSSISVVGWTVPGSGHTAAGQIPPVSNLKPGAASATAYFGARTNVFGGNFVAQHVPASNPDSQSYVYQGIEFDFQNYGTTDYQMSVIGLALNYSPINGTVKATADSVGIIDTGFPIGIKLGYNTTAIEVIPNCPTTIGSGVFNVYNWFSPAVWAGSPTTNLTWQSTNFVDNNELQLRSWVSRDINGTGWPSASMHLGMYVDVSPMAGIVFNSQQYGSASIGFTNSAGTIGLAVDNSLNTWVSGALNVSGNISAGGLVTTGSVTATSLSTGGFSVNSAGAITATSINVVAPPVWPIATKTGTSYTVSPTDVTLIIDASGTFTLTLPSVSANNGRVLWLMSQAAHLIQSASSNVVQLGTTGAATTIINGTTGYSVLQSNGTNWIVIAAGSGV